MKYRLLNFLVCSRCGKTFRMRVFKEIKCGWEHIPIKERCDYFCYFNNDAVEENRKKKNCTTCFGMEIKDGLLECSCNTIFPVVDYIPRMLPDAFCGLDSFLKEYKNLLPMERIERRWERKEVRTFMRMQKKTRKSFGYEWLRYDVDLEEEDRDVFLNDSQIPVESFKDKVVLDAGCGMGRYTRIAGRTGVEIIGVDLSQSVLKAYKMTQNNPFIHIVQGDILQLPFREKQFDIIYSLGVLHHTPSARKAFLTLIKYLREGGLISIWVYGTARKFRDFKTNPLREDRQGCTQNTMVKRLHWVIVYIREIVFKIVRLVTARMYVPFLYLLCYPLAAVGKIPLLKYLTASVHRNWRVRLQENFDWFSPQYQSHHSKEEVLSWFNEARLDDISMLKHGFIPKVGLRGTNRRERS